MPTKQGIIMGIISRWWCYMILPSQDTTYIPAHWQLNRCREKKNTITTDDISKKGCTQNGGCGRGSDCSARGKGPKCVEPNGAASDSLIIRLGSCSCLFGGCSCRLGGCSCRLDGCTCREQGWRPPGGLRLKNRERITRRGEGRRRCLDAVATKPEAFACAPILKGRQVALGRRVSLEWRPNGDKAVQANRKIVIVILLARARRDAARIERGDDVCATWLARFVDTRHVDSRAYIQTPTALSK